MLAQRLAEVLARTLATVEDAPDDQIELDFAVQLAEDVAFRLQSLDVDQRLELVRLLNVIADDADQPSWAAWVRGLPEALGLETA